MISVLLKDYRSIYDKYFQVGKSYSYDQLIKQDKNNSFDKKLWKHLGENGCLGLNADKKFNGNNFSALKTCVAFEALSAGCENNGVIFSAIAHLFACIIPISLYGTDKQQSEFLSKMTSGEWIGANAITEQNSGSDVFKMDCTAVKSKGKFYINGHKKYITNSPIADVVVLFAMTDK